MKALVIARISVLRTLRNRMGLFFLFLLPMILIVVLGMTYGGMGGARIGVSGADEGPLAGDLVAGFKGTDLRLDVRRYASADALRDAVERGFVEFGVAIPAGYDAAIHDGKTASVETIAQTQSVASAVQTAVDAAIADQAGLVRAARFTAAHNGIGFDQAFAAARAEQPSVAGVGVVVQSVGDVTVNPSGFAVGAESQLILFMFLTSLTGAVPLIISRQLGISRREFSTPTGAGTIILGEALGRFALALFQGAFIVVASALLFGVDWMDPMATGAIVVAFAMVSAGAAMLIGAVAANSSQAGAVGAGLGMMLGLLGGTMVPPEVFPSIMRTISHVTPHAWAIDAFHDMLLNGARFTDVLPQIGALLAFAAALLALAAWRFRRVIVGGAT